MRRLLKIRNGLTGQIEKLQGELAMVEEVIEEKRSEAPTVRREADSNGGKFEGLPRSELLKHVREVGRPVKPAEMRDALAAKGIDRRVEAVRNGLMRLVKDGDVKRTRDGKFVVKNGGGAQSETDSPSRESNLDSRES
jgi:hypothetical protein